MQPTQPHSHAAVRIYTVKTHGLLKILQAVDSWKQQPKIPSVRRKMAEPDHSTTEQNSTILNLNPSP